jgi:hypothetical protein
MVLATDKEELRANEGLRSSLSSRCCAVVNGGSCLRHGFRVSGFEFRVSGFGFRVSGLGSRVSDFGFRVSG